MKPKSASATSANSSLRKLQSQAVWGVAVGSLFIGVPVVVGRWGQLFLSATPLESLKILEAGVYECALLASGVALIGAVAAFSIKRKGEVTPALVMQTKYVSTVVRLSLIGGGIFTLVWLGIPASLTLFRGELGPVPLLVSGLKLLCIGFGAVWAASHLLVILVLRRKR